MAWSRYASVTIKTHHLTGLPVLILPDTWRSLFAGDERSWLTSTLTGSQVMHRHIVRTGRPIRGGQILDIIPVPYEATRAYLVLLALDYDEGNPSMSILPLAYASHTLAEQIQTALPQTLVAHIWSSEGPGILYHALWNGAFGRALLNAIIRRRTLSGEYGRMLAAPERPYDHCFAPYAQTPERSLPLDPYTVQAEGNVILAHLGNRFMLKLFRQVDKGTDPGLEVSRFLSQQTAFDHIVPIIGSLEYHSPWHGPITFAVLQEHTASTESAWNHALHTLDTCFQHLETLPPTRDSLPQAETLLAPYLHTTRLLAHRTATLHQALSDSQHNPSFAPERFSNFYQRSIYQCMQDRATRVLDSLRRSRGEMSEPTRTCARDILAREETVHARFYALFMQQIIVLRRIRCHGNYRLHHLYYTDTDILIANFAGNAACTVSEDRMKCSPLCDVAAILSSFHAAVSHSLREHVAGCTYAHTMALTDWADFTYSRIVTTFLQAYMHDSAEASLLLPQNRAQADALLQCYLLDTTFRELATTLESSNPQAYTPLRLLLQLLSEKDNAIMPRIR